MSFTAFPSTVLDFFLQRHIVQVVPKHACIGGKIAECIPRSLRGPLMRLGPDHHLPGERLHASVNLVPIV